MTQIKNNALRMPFMDNLRSAMIFFVVLIHTGFIYDYALSPIWILNDPAKNMLSFKTFIVIDIFIIPILFFVAGFFTPSSIKKQNNWKFVLTKAKRLLLPWLIAVMTLLPLHQLIFFTSRNMPLGTWTDYFHFTKGVLSNQNWLWFLPVLFLFNLVFFLLSRIIKKEIKISVPVAAISFLIVGCIYSFTFFQMRWQGWTKTVVLDFQNERILIYFMVFLLGAVCKKSGIFEKPVEKRFRYLWALPVTAAFVFVYWKFRFSYLLYRGNMSLISFPVDNIIRAVSFNLSLAGLLYLFINTFRNFLNFENKLSKTLSRTSYGVYLIHLVVTGAIGLPFMAVALPGAAKWLILTFAAFAASTALVAVYNGGARWLKIKKAA